MQRPQASQHLDDRPHQLPIHLVVRVDLLHQSPFGRQFSQHLLLRSAQNQPFSAQMIAQQRRIANQMIAISVAPRAREAFPIAKAVKIQNIDHIPDFRSLIIDRRAGKADDPFTFLG